jgi:hypothetical protein
VFSCVFAIFLIAETYTFRTNYMCFHCRNMFFLFIFLVFFFLLFSFACVFYMFTLCFIAETCNFCAFYIYTRIHMYHILYMNCTILLIFHVFTLCSHCRNLYFWYISFVYKNTSVSYFKHQMHCFLVFLYVLTELSLK